MTYTRKSIVIAAFLFSIISPAFAQQPETLIPIAKNFFSAMEQGKFHDAYLMLDTSITKVISEAQNTAGWKSIRAKLGALKRQTKVRTEETLPYTGVYLTCVFDSGTIDLKVVFKEGAHIVGYFFVPVQKYKIPSYADTTALIERNVEVKTGNYVLSGILTLPKKGDHFPIIVLVHGSGPNDKDETIDANKPFKD